MLSGRPIGSFFTRRAGVWGFLEPSSLTSFVCITVSDLGIFNPAWPQGRPAERSVAHPLREWVPEAMHCALMLRMSMAAVRFQRG